jgi:NleD-like pathogen effector protein (putative zinc metallopeptidase)
MDNTLGSKKMLEHSSTCLCGQCLAREFNAKSWRERDRIARSIISARSLEELCRITPESRHFLREVLSLGYAPRKDKEALAKLLTAELLNGIQADKLAAIEYQSGSIIKGTRDFIEKVNSQLDSITAIPIGDRLLQSLSRSGRTVTIVFGSRTNDARPDNYRAAVALGKVLKWRDESGGERAIRGNGSGSDTTIRYNPDLSQIGSTEGWQRQPPAVWLAHELIHADDAAYGRMDPEYIDGIRNYERQAIGLPPFDQKEFTENKFRAAWVEPQPLRPRY